MSEFVKPLWLKGHNKYAAHILKALTKKGCSASQMSTERGGPNSVLKTRAEHFVRHLNTRLRSLSETEDGSWSAAGEQVSISSSSDNDIFYDIDSSLVSPQEEAAEPQFINHNHSDNLSDNSEDYTASDSTSAPSSNGPIKSDSSDTHFYDVISEREDLNDCTDQIPEECEECYRRAKVTDTNAESDHLSENHINGIEIVNNCNNVRHRTELALCDKCVKKKDSCDISCPKYSKVWREDNASPEENTGVLKISEKWDDVDLTAVQDDCCRQSTVPTTINEHNSHNGSRESDEDEWHEESKLASAKDVLHHGHNGLASDTCDHLSLSNPVENEEELPISHTETRSNGIHEELDTKNVETEISSCEPSSSDSASNERLGDPTDSDNNLSLSELLHVLQKEYKNKSGVTTSCQNSETKSDDNCLVASDATQTDDDVTQKADTNEDDEEEDIEVRRLRFRKCSSLKSGKTPPGTPGRKKIVRFADVLGLDLADVKTFLDEIPTIPRSAYRDLHDIELSSSPVENTFGISQQPSRSERVLLPLFQQPGGQPFFLERVKDNNVCLENAIVSDPVLFAITGTVRVKNIDYHKSVHIRYTIDNWKTFADLQARYVPNSCDGFSDKFSFLLYAHTLDIGNRLEFAVRFQTRGTQYWDSNGGTNYVFQCVSKDPTPSMICVQAASSSYTAHSPVDTWPTFY